MNCRGVFEQGEKSGSKRQPWKRLCSNSSSVAGQAIAEPGEKFWGFSLIAPVQKGIVEEEQAYKWEEILRGNFEVCFLGQDGIVDKILDL